MTAYIDSDYRTWGHAGHIVPWETKNVNPASIDLTLGKYIRTPRWYWRTPLMRRVAWMMGKHLWLLNGTKYKDSLYWNGAKSFKRYLLWPGDFVLCATAECVYIPPDAMGMLFLKSSAGRMGFEHSHSAYIDPGFVGTLTLELYNSAPWPLELVAGERLVQLVLVKTTERPVELYGEVGHYQNQCFPTISTGEKYGSI
jgi:deoxycytidine triphosphate deaminase